MHLGEWFVVHVWSIGSVSQKENACLGRREVRRPIETVSPVACHDMIIYRV